MSGAYDDCGSDAYDDGQPRTLDLLSADYGDASQLTWYVGDDGLVHACAHNLLRSSANFEDGIWGGTGTVAGPQLLSLTAGQTGGYQAFNGTSNRYQSINGETYMLTSTVEVTAVTTPGEVNGRLLSNTGVNSISATLTNIGDTATLSVTHIAGSTNMQVFVCNSTTFEGTVKITNLCASVGSETFPYIKTDETGARYMYRLPENLRRWSGTAYTTSKIVELNTGVTVNALVEGVAVTNQVLNSGWTAAVVGDLASTGSAGSTWTDARSAQFTSDGGVMEVTTTGVIDGIPHIDLRITGTFTGVATTDISTITSTVAATGDVWTSSVLVELLDETDTGGYTETLLRLNEYATSSFLATTGAKSISLAELQATSGPTSFSFMGTLGQATTNAVGIQFRVVVGVGDVDMTIRVWCPMLTETSFVPQPILTYGSTVTRAAEAPVTSDFAGASTNGIGSFRTSFVYAVDQSLSPVIVWNGTTSGEYVRLSVRDFDGDGDGYAILQNNPGTPDENTDLTQYLLVDRTQFVAGGWSEPGLEISIAGTDLTTSAQDTLAVSAFAAGLGDTLGLAHRGGSQNPVVGFITALYIPNVFLTEAQYTGEAT